MYSRACVYFENGYFLEFFPSNQRVGFPPAELVKLNSFAKKRSGVLFVHVDESPLSKDLAINRNISASA